MALTKFAAGQLATKGAVLAAMSSTYDVLGLGITAIDDLLYVEAYPPPDAKTRVLRSERHCGGLTATALVAAARLGARCAYAGMLGDDELSRFVTGRLQAEGIDTAPVIRRADACPAHSRIIVDVTRQTRNIFYELKGAVGADPDRPPAEVIRSAKVLFVDHYGLPGTVRAVRIARAAGIPIVADLERQEDTSLFLELLGQIDHLIVSENFALALTGEKDPAMAARALWTPERQVVVVTCGPAGSWSVDGAGEPRRQPAYPVQVVDTTGCGDVFHGAYAAGLALGQSLPERLRLASAAAALKATQPGGQAGIPNRAEVEAFLKERDERLDDLPLDTFEKL